jgi:hypothetical protein
MTEEEPKKEVCGIWKANKAQRFGKQKPGH